MKEKLLRIDRSELVDLAGREEVGEFVAGFPLSLAERTDEGQAYFKFAGIPVSVESYNRGNGLWVTSTANIEGEHPLSIASGSKEINSLDVELSRHFQGQFSLNDPTGFDFTYDVPVNQDNLFYLTGGLLRLYHIIDFRVLSDLIEGKRYLPTTKLDLRLGGDVDEARTILDKTRKKYHMWVEGRGGAD